VDLVRGRDQGRRNTCRVAWKKGAAVHPRRKFLADNLEKRRKKRILAKKKGEKKDGTERGAQKKETSGVGEKNDVLLVSVKGKGTFFPLSSKKGKRDCREKGEGKKELHRRPVHRNELGRKEDHGAAQHVGEGLFSTLRKGIWKDKREERLDRGGKGGERKGRYAARNEAVEGLHSAKEWS